MQIKTVKVSNNGQISIPAEIREKTGIKKGDTLLMLEDKGKIMLDASSDHLEDDFEDLLKLSEKSAKELWDNEKDKIWDEL